jgi:DNA repair exonuclease SbcCD ATPase subunit
MENEDEETQKSPETDDGASTLEDLEAIKAQLEEEKKAKAAAEAALADKAKRIVELQAEGEALRAEQSNLLASLSEVKRGSEAAVAELSQTKEAHAKAISKYLEAVRASNPTIPGDVIVGGTIEEIDASVQKAKAIANAVKTNLEAQAKEAKVPAGAPTRGEISLEGLSPREKIAAGLNQKGGTS